MRSSGIETRKRLVRLVGQFPGLHLRELARQADLSEALAGYHLGMLVTDGLLEVVEDGAFRRYYPRQPDSMEKMDQALIGLLRQPVPLRIALILLEKGPTNHTTLTKEIGLAKSTLTYHLQKLEDAGFVTHAPEGAGYQLREPSRVRATLTRWEPPDGLTSRFTALWNRFYSRQYGRR